MPIFDSVLPNILQKRDLIEDLFGGMTKAILAATHSTWAMVGGEQSGLCKLCPTFTQLLVHTIIQHINHSTINNQHPTPTSMTTQQQQQAINKINLIQPCSCEHNLPTLPSFYPLERSPVFVSQASASIFALRITTVLTSRSIPVTYDTHTTKVDCISKAGVEFCIRLYHRRGEYKHGIIVEVQRRTGFDLSYAQYAYIILDAVKGKSVNQ